MNPNLKKLIQGKREWTEPLLPDEQKKGFKGWYASKNLPHFDSPGTTQFITWRLADSMPAARRQEWEAFLHLEDEAEKRKQIELYIDRGLGACHLRDPRIAEMIQSSLWQYDGAKCRLLAWVLMPNHVHVLVEIWGVPMAKLLHNWKGYTAKKANKILGVKGTFWADDYFDRYIRDETHFQRVRRYIENNPVSARLAKAPEDWVWSSARYRSKEDFEKLLHRKNAR
jgi:REP element-mobilizing transposase RayT